MRSEDFLTQCNNEECGWEGLASETVHPKHDPETQLCPKCHETTEPADIGEY